MSTLLGQGERKSGVRRVTAADVIPAANSRRLPCNRLRNLGSPPPSAPPWKTSWPRGRKCSGWGGHRAIHRPIPATPRFWLVCRRRSL